MGDILSSFWVRRSVLTSELPEWISDLSCFASIGQQSERIKNDDQCRAFMYEHSRSNAKAEQCGRDQKGDYTEAGPKILPDYMAGRTT